VPGVENIPGVPQCETCGTQLNARTGTIYEHIIADGLGGTPTLDNCRVHCKTCADLKTHQEDNPRMAKADRVIKATYGLERRKKEIQSHGFGKRPPQNNASRPVQKWRPDLENEDGLDEHDDRAG
jgi:hypothetical protein